MKTALADTAVTCGLVTALRAVFVRINTACVRRSDFCTRKRRVFFFSIQAYLSYKAHSNYFPSISSAGPCPRSANLRISRRDSGRLAIDASVIETAC